MKHIRKGKEPHSLLVHRKSYHAAYNNLPTNAKKEIRNTLLREQGYICCYCMERIREENTKIEHWKPQKRYPDLQLDYHNLLASCRGGEGRREDKQHCDTHKGEQEITINPSDKTKNCERFIKYRGSGKTDSEEPVIREELNRILNLNTQTLVKNRKAIKDQVIKELNRISGRNSVWLIQYVKKMIQKYESRHNGKYIPYCQVVVYFLKNRFANELSRGKI